MVARGAIAGLARAALCALGLLSATAGLASSASAAPITYVLTGDFTGTSGPPVAFTWTITGDTTAVTSVQGLPAVPSITDVISLAGIGNAVPAVQVFAVAAAVDDAAAFVDGAGTQGVEWGAPQLATWNAVTPIGPLDVSFLAATPLPTDLGDLNVTAGSNLVFTATAGAQVFEPSTIALVLGGIAGLIACSAVRAAVRKTAPARGRRPIGPACA